MLTDGMRALLYNYNATVCPCDHVLNHKHCRAFIVANSEHSRRTGKHWVVLHFPREGKPEFFDPLGNLPGDYNPHFDQALGKNYIGSSVKLQRPKDKNCGSLCITFVKLRATGLPYNKCVRWIANHRGTSRSQSTSS